MEIDETHPGNPTDTLVRDIGVLKDAMEMDDDGACRRAYGKDDLEFDHIDSGQAQNRGAPSQNSGKKKQKDAREVETRASKPGNKCWPR